MTDPGAQKFVIQHDGLFLYAVAAEDLGGNYGGAASEAVVYADDRAMTPLGARGDFQKFHWYASDRQASELWVQHRPRKVLDGYRLDDETMASVRFPLTLTADEYSAHAEAHRFDDDDRYCYSRIEHDEPCERELLYDDAGTWPPIGGFAPEYRADGPQWTPSLPAALLHRPEYRHLFPGSLHGLRDHLIEEIKTLPNVQYAFAGKNGGPGIDVTLHLPFEQPVTYFERDTRSRRKDAGRTRVKMVDRRIHLAVPNSVAGTNYTDALAAWDAAVEHWLAAVRGATVKACNHCDGHGYVAVDSPSGGA